MNEIIDVTASCAEVRQARPAPNPAADGSLPPNPRVAVDGDLAQNWAQVIGAFADATYNQLHFFAGQVWGHANLSHIAVRQGDQIVAAAQVILQRVPLIGRGVAFVKFGPLWRRKGRSPDLGALVSALDAIKEEYAARRRLMVIILPAPDPIHGAAVDEVLAMCGFTVRRTMSDPNRYLVDTRLSEDEQLVSLEQKWRYNLKKSLKSELDLSVHHDLEGIVRFMPIFKAMQERKGYDDKQASLSLPALLGELPPEQQPWIVIARHEGRDVAGCVVGAIGDTAYYLFGATDTRSLRCNAGYALQWKTIELLRQRPSVRWYDLGGEANDLGLRQFKKGLVGTRGRVARFSGEFDYCTDRMSQFLVDQMLRLRGLRRHLRSPLERVPLPEKEGIRNRLTRG